MTIHFINDPLFVEWSKPHRCDFLTLNFGMKANTFKAKEFIVGVYSGIFAAGAVIQYSMK